jgi:N-acetylmuramoyl-L-alanine amidase
VIKVAIDPGHGGYDPGAVGPTGVQEKNVTLAIALFARDYLKQQGVDVVLTRDGDYTPGHASPDYDLQARCDIANNAGANCFVSIHCNSSTNRDAQGTEAYYYEGSQEGMRLASLLNKHIFTDCGTPTTALFSVKPDVVPATPQVAAAWSNRGLKASHFYVLAHTVCPAALVEVAFISNPTEEAWLETPKNQELTGKAIAKAICEYLGVKWMDQITPEQAIDWLASKGVISDPAFWKTALNYVKELDSLFIKLYAVFKNLS